MLEDSSAARMSSYRRNEGFAGEWLDAPARDALSVNLDIRDAAILSTTVTTMGYTLSSTDRWAEVAHFSAGRVVFAEASWLSKFISRFPSELLGDIVAVARTDSLPAAWASQHAGVADVLASPLSPQQIVGAIGRLSTLRGAERHPEIGLRVYRAASPDFGMPAMLLRIASGKTDVVQSYFRLRRFLRGYDGLGVTPEGELAANVLAPALHADAILDRVKLIVGETIDVEVVDVAASVKQTVAA